MCDKTSERGQAMTESVAIICVLMIAIVGLMGLVSLQRRVYLENLATASLNLTLATFTAAERGASQWPERNLDEAAFSEKIAELVINTPVDRFDSPSGAKQIPLRVAMSNHSRLSKMDCQDELSVRATGALSTETQYAVHGCSKERGWLMPVKNLFQAFAPVPAPQTSSRIDPVPLTTLIDPQQNLVSEVLTTKGLYMGKGDFVFTRRVNEPWRSYSLRDGSFDGRHAHMGTAQTERNFNRDCLFNPFTQLTACRTKPSFGAVYVVLGRISSAQFIASASACTGELIGRYGVYAGGILAGGALAAWRSGSESNVCTTTENVIKNTDKSARMLIKTANTSTRYYEDATLQLLESQIGSFNPIDSGLGRILRD